MTQPNATTARLIAFYLPQFHPIPENDKWWGRGFTEWTNVAAAEPLFPGHLQPTLPSELGFCDLRVPEVRQAQADLARTHGIHGFCYYHYWFNGKRLLDRPFREVLESGQPDFPFCLCWANENWTRAWDGQDHEVLMAQDHGPDDDERHMQWLAPALKDPRYIRVDGKPLLLVYRVSKLLDAKRTASVWRREARRLGIGDIFLALVQSLRDDRLDPKRIGFDAAVEFQPDWFNLGNPIATVGENNSVYSYRSLVEAALAKQPPDFRHFRCVTTGWDNTPRRRRNASVFTGSTPELYQQWLERVLRSQPAGTEPPVVFVNAWNEWAEGAHLEPDNRWGRRFLEATSEALRVSVSPVTTVNRNSESSGLSQLSGELSAEGAAIQQPPVEPADPHLGRVLLDTQRELERAKEEIAALRQSLSWKVTKPLRAGYDRLKK